MRRIVDARGSRDFDTFRTFVTGSPHFRGFGTDESEFWDDAQRFVRIHQMQTQEMEAGVRGAAGGTLEVLDAFEDGGVGWASLIYRLSTPTGDVALRLTAVLALEFGAWKVVQWHASVPTPNVHTFGIELTTTIDDLLEAVAEDAEAQDTLSRAEGTMTLVFTDVVDSTPIAEKMGDRAWVELMKEHESDIRRITSRHGGAVVKMIGDGSMLAFESARAAIRASLDLESAAADLAFEIRIGIHAGEVVRTDNDLLGTTVNKAARVASVATGGQVLISSLVAELAGRMEGVVVGAPETVALKGLSGVHTVMNVGRTTSTAGA